MKETKNEKSMSKMSSIIYSIIVMFIMIIFYQPQNSYSRNMNLPSITKIEYINRDSLKSKMIIYVDKVISKYTKGKHDKNLSLYFVDNSIKHNIDICFMLSQSKIETCFGLTGIGKSKKSLFGVKTKKRYSSYNEAIDHYCRILNKNYLVKGRTEQDLLKRFVNKNGKRYAASLKYEYSLRKTYYEIYKHLQKYTFI